MDPLADPRFFDLLARHDKLYDAFARRATSGVVDAAALPSILEDMCAHAKQDACNLRKGAENVLPPRPCAQGATAEGMRCRD